MFSTLYIRLMALAAIIGFVVAAGFAAYNYAYDKGASAVKSEWDAAEVIRTEEISKLKAKADKSTLDLVESHLKQQKILNEKNINLNKSIAAITRELQLRPDRPSITDVPSGTCVRTGSTGAELYRPDAEFLIGEAARAEQVVIQLEMCTVMYNRVYEESLRFQTK